MSSIKPAGARFFAKVAIPSDPTECWEWQARRAKNGYGRFRGRHNKMVGAHRFAYELMVAPIPEGLYVCHSCDNKGCVNPRHLFTGTALDNMRDRHDKGGYGTAAKGEKNGCAKLKERDVHLIRFLSAETGVSNSRLGRAFGVHHDTIGRIVRGERWRHV